MFTNATSLLVTGPFNEARVKETAQQLRQQLKGKPTFGLVFATPDYLAHGEDFLELLRLHGHIPTLVGAASTGLIGQNQEQEGGSGFSLLLVSAPGAQAHPVSFTQEQVDEADSPAYWYQHTGLKAKEVKAWLVFLDPLSLHPEAWLKQWNLAYPNVPILGGLATPSSEGYEDKIFCNDRVTQGNIALALTGNIAVHSVVSQGCKPIGEPLTVTQADRNILLALGSRPAYDVLNDVYKDLTEEEKQRAAGHLFAGLAMSEYQDDYKHGDFLVRNIIGADPHSGAVAITSHPRIGQTIQYQLRDPLSASQEMRTLLQAKAASLTVEPYAALLCTCLGRGMALFGKSHHDANLIYQTFPDLPIAGFFANGEIGPVGPKSYTHAYTASIALIAPEAESV